MRIGVFVQEKTVDAAVMRVTEARRLGAHRAWIPQIFKIDALTALGVIGREVEGIELGTSVVPTYPRHPTALATQARTVQQLAHGRFTLGIGLSHRVIVTDMLGMKWGEVRHLREYLSILMPLLRGEPVDFVGETLTGRYALEIPADPVPVVVAALGTKMLTLAGEWTDGTTTWMTGLDTLRSHVIPTIRAAAVDRPDPQIVAALPVAVTDRPDDARTACATLFKMYGRIPSYRAMLDREGAAGPADVAVVGHATEVRSQIERFAEAGVTEFVFVPFFERERTLDLVGELAA